MELKDVLALAIKQASPSDEIYSIWGTACDIDEDEMICTVEPLDGSADIHDCHLQYFIPKEDSLVVVTFLNKNTGYVALCKDIAKIKMDAESIIFNDGELGGIPMLKELKENLQSLKDFVEAMNSALPGAFSAVGAGTAAAGANGATKYNASMAGKSIEIKDMENTKIKQ